MSKFPEGMLYGQSLDVCILRSAGCFSIDGAVSVLLNFWDFRVITEPTA